MENIITTTKELNIIFAVSLPEENRALQFLLEKKELPYRLLCPGSLSELDRMAQENKIDLIITDLEFQNGSLVDWLVLWPYPFILLADPGSFDKLSPILADEASTFLIRRDDGTHINFIPSMIRKVLGVRESQTVQNNFLRISEKQYMNLVQALPDIIYVLDTDGHFTFINNAVRSLGWEPVELIGKHFSSLLYSDDLSKVSRQSILPSLRGRVTGNDRAPKLFDERRTGSRMTRGLRMKLKRKPSVGGSIDVSLIAYGEISAIGYTGFQGTSMSELGTAGIIREEKSSTSTGTNAESIFYTEGALGHNEVMHLINNKLQILSSLVSLKQSLCEDPVSCISLNEVQIQVYTLSLVYQNMVTVDGEVRVRMETYLDDIIKHLVSSYAGNPWIQKIDLHCAPIHLEEDPAITVSLFVNELITIFLKIQDNLDNGISPLTITFLVNNNIAQLKIRSSEIIFREYTENMEKESFIILKTLIEILKGEIFVDKESLTLFFNID